MVHVCQQKQILPWLQNEFLFQASSYKKPYDKALHALHKFTRTVIYERRKKYQVGSQQNAESTTKGRVSFLGKGAFKYYVSTLGGEGGFAKCLLFLMRGEEGLTKCLCKHTR